MQNSKPESPDSFYTKSGSSPPKQLPSIGRLREVLSYDPETGEIRTRVARRGTPVGKLITAKMSDGRISLTVDGIKLHGHHVAWAMQHGRWADGYVLHRNGDKSDNRIANLEGVTVAEACRRNARPSNNTSGIRGVAKASHRDCFRAYISIADKQIHLGFFDSIHDARRAREAAEARIWGKDGGAA